jgi:beta-galactosidase
VDVTPNYGTDTRRTFFGYVRAFVRARREAGDVGLVIGAINGERRQLTSNQVSIDVQRLALRGSAAPAAFAIHYTTDGSAPTPASSRYTGAFAVPLGTTVRASVWENGNVVLQLEERFAADVGIHWLAEDEAQLVSSSGRQAEDARLSGGARIDTEEPGHYGTGCVVLPLGGAVEWYEENDGSAGPFKLQMRWQSAAAAGIAFTVNGRDIALPALQGAFGPDKWQTMEFSAPFQAGANTLRMTLRSGGPLLVDELVVTSAP